MTDDELEQIARNALEQHNCSSTETIHMWVLSAMRAAVLADQEARWQLIESLPADSPFLFTWWDDWGKKWIVESRPSGAAVGTICGKRNGKSVFWMPPPLPPATHPAEESQAENKEPS